MSTSPESEIDLELHFLPAWAKQSPEANRYAHYEGEREERPRGRGGDRGERRSRPPRRDGAPGDRTRKPMDSRGPRRDTGGRGPRPAADPRANRDVRERREPLAPLPELRLEVIPEEKGVESLARQIRLTGRAYPLFEIAWLILKKPERYHLNVSVVKKPDGQVAQPLFVCSLDDTLWLSEAEAMAHILARHFDTFYQTDRTPTDPPKGIYTFVAQCGITGTILGPPNFHDYQNKLRKLHAERFSRMPFEVFKSRVKIVKDEAIVKKWTEEQSFKTEFICLNVPDSPRLASREEVEKHFRETHLANLVKPVETHTLKGSAQQQPKSPALNALCRRAWEEQMAFPLKVANVLSRQFASHGLAFFKVNRTVTHVAIARPHFLDIEATPVSENVKRIIKLIDATPRCTRRKLFETLAPAPPAPAASAEKTEGAPEAAPSELASPEQTALAGDLHWLIHQGHVIEFANGILETAKRPLPKPEKTPKETTPAESAPQRAETSPAETASTEPEIAAEAPTTVPANSSSSSSVS